MKKIVLFISCLFCFVLTNAQTPNFEWAKSIGGTSADVGKSIAVDALGNVYTTGYFAGTVDFDPGPGIFNLTTTNFSGFPDIFISKLDEFGNFLWAKNIGDTLGGGAGNSIALDASGNVYCTGYFKGTVDFDPGGGIFNLISTTTNYGDIFISKFDPSGNFFWATQMGGSGNDQGVDIELDALGNVYTTGSFQVTADFEPGAGVFNLTSSAPVHPSFSQGNIFISKLDLNGNFVWAKSMVGTYSGAGNSIAVDALGSVYTTGQFQDTVDFDPGIGIVNLNTDSLCSDIFISKLNVSGDFVWAKQVKHIGGTFYNYNYGNDITLDTFDNVYTTGLFQGTADFDPGVGIVSLTAGGLYDMFISKLDSSGNFLWVKSMEGTGIIAGNSIVIDTTGGVYTTGQFQYTIDFDPGLGTFNLTSAASDDLFISKLDSFGNFMWAKNMGGASTNVGNSIALDAIGNVYTTGQFAGTTDFDPDFGTFDLTSAGSYDIFVLKLSQTPTGINETINSSNISIYPNPNNGTFNISISSQFKNASIEVYNSLGALVFKQEIVNQENSIELLNQSNGLYFVKVMSENKIVGMGKIVKQ